MQKYYRYQILLVASFMILSMSINGCQHNTLNSEQKISQPLEKWEARKLSDSYSIEQAFGCFCAPPAGRYQRLNVVDNKIVRIVDVETGEVLASDQHYLFKTVAELFEFANSVDPDSVAVLQVEYDETYGYPKDVYIDYSARIADEELGYGSRNLVFVVE